MNQGFKRGSQTDRQTDRVYMYIYKHQETYIFILIYYILIPSEIVCFICCLLQKRLKADNLHNVTLFSDAFVAAQIIYLLQITE